MKKNVALLLSALILSALPCAVFAQIHLNEIMADPSSDWDGIGGLSTRGDEYVEIINAGGTSVNLASYRLGDESGGYVWRFAFTGVMAPHEIRVVFGSDALAWQSANGYPAYGLSLNNSGDAVYLYELSGADTVIADLYVYAPFEVLDDRSVGRDPDGSGSWAIFDGLNPYTGKTAPFGTGCNPTPGFESGCVTPTVRSTWGQIKSTYED